jgi:hypothetical protein
MAEEQKNSKRAYVWDDTHKDIKRLAAIWEMDQPAAIDRAVKMAVKEAIKELTSSRAA